MSPIPAHDLIVNHRRPPDAMPRMLATICRRCHPRVPYWNRLPWYVSPFMRQLWREANPQVPEQLPLLVSDFKNQQVVEQQRFF